MSRTSIVKPTIENFLPMAPATLHILLALAGERLHGYGIMQEIARQSEGRYKPGPGILYDNLQRLVRDRLVEEIESQDPRRRDYRLSSFGRTVLAAEIARLEGVIRTAQAHLRPRRT